MTKRNAILLALGCSFVTGAVCTYFSCAIVFFGRLPGFCNF